uniref:PDZ domain-containing protein n=1 Tax=Steinernema glaseri TaxID=37863 RepID=A0A1I7YRE5_9BILA
MHISLILPATHLAKWFESTFAKETMPSSRPGSPGAVGFKANKSAVLQVTSSSAVVLLTNVFQKSKTNTGLEITDNGEGKSSIKRIREGSVSAMNQPAIAVGDCTTAINGVSMEGKSHFEVARVLRTIPAGQEFLIRLVSPLKSGFNFITALRARANGHAALQEAPFNGIGKSLPPAASRSRPFRVTNPALVFIALSNAPVCFGGSRAATVQDIFNFLRTHIASFTGRNAVKYALSTDTFVRLGSDDIGEVKIVLVGDGAAYGRDLLYAVCPTLDEAALRRRFFPPNHLNGLKKEAPSNGIGKSLPPAARCICHRERNRKRLCLAVHDPSGVTKPALVFVALSNAPGQSTQVRVQLHASQNGRQSLFSPSTRPFGVTFLALAFLALANAPVCLGGKKAATSLEISSFLVAHINSFTRRNAVKNSPSSDFFVRLGADAASSRRTMCTDLGKSCETRVLFLQFLTALTVGRAPKESHCSMDFSVFSCKTKSLACTSCGLTLDNDSRSGHPPFTQEVGPSIVFCALVNAPICAGGWKAASFSDIFTFVFKCDTISFFLQKPDVSEIQIQHRSSAIPNLASVQTMGHTWRTSLRGNKQENWRNNMKWFLPLLLLIVANAPSSEAFVSDIYESIKNWWNPTTTTTPQMTTEKMLATSTPSEVAVYKDNQSNRQKRFLDSLFPSKCGRCSPFKMDLSLIDFSKIVDKVLRREPKVIEKGDGCELEVACEGLNAGGRMVLQLTNGTLIHLTYDGPLQNVSCLTKVWTYSGIPLLGISCELQETASTTTGSSLCGTCGTLSTNIAQVTNKANNQLPSMEGMEIRTAEVQEFSEGGCKKYKVICDNGDAYITMISVLDQDNEIKFITGDYLERVEATLECSSSGRVGLPPIEGIQQKMEPSITHVICEGK